MLSFSEPISQLPSGVWLFVLGMTVVPQIVGHGLIAWSLTKVSAAVVALVVLFEPLIAGWIAWLVFDETPSPAFFVGAVIVLFGVVLVVSNESNKTTA